jgi:CheY-like chemotaxis protein
VAEPLVVIAHETETIREAIRRLCGDAGYRTRAAADGHAAVAALAERPAAIVLDVALPELHAWAVIEEARQRSPATRVVLVASIYNRTGYKRRPTSLYGADDYVEQHHIPDALLGKLERLIGPAPRSVEPPAAHALTPEAARIRDAGEARLTAPVATPTATRTVDGQRRAVERAERLARIIVADIALYNGDALDAAEHADDAELQARLRTDLEEGRLLFELRVPEPVRRGRDFIAEALEELRRERRAG